MLDKATLTDRDYQSFFPRVLLPYLGLKETLIISYFCRKDKNPIRCWLTDCAIFFENERSEEKSKMSGALAQQA